MLPKKNKVTKREVDLVFKKGGFCHGDSLFFCFIKDNSIKQAKISFIAPKKIAKLANRRSYLRRRGYLALEPVFKSIPKGIVGVFTFKKNESNREVLTNEIQKILNKIN